MLDDATYADAGLIGAELAGGASLRAEPTDADRVGGVAGAVVIEEKKAERATTVGCCCAGDEAEDEREETGGVDTAWECRGWCTW